MSHRYEPALAPLGELWPTPGGRARRLAGAAAGSLASAVSAYRNRRRRRRAERQLTALDDHMLKDIGISRAEVIYAVRMGRDGAHLHPRRKADR